MSNFTKKEFADLCGMDTRKLAVYIGRGKIVVDKKGYIDDKNEINALFRAKNVVGKDEKRQEKVEKEAENTAKSQKAKRSESESNELLEIERRRKLAELEKTNTDIRILKLKEEKMIGGSMPIDLVKLVVSNLSKSFINEFKNSTNDILRVLSKTKEFSQAEMAEISGQMSHIINHSMKHSLDNSKKEMNAIVKDFSEKRGVG